MVLLGHVISKEIVSVDPSKVEAVLNWSRLSTVAEIRSFMGLVGYYHRFIVLSISPRLLDLSRVLLGKMFLLSGHRIAERVSWSFVRG